MGLGSVATAAVMSGPLKANASSIADIIKLAPDIPLTCKKAVYSDRYNLQLRIADKWGLTNYWPLLIDVSSAHVRPRATPQLRIADYWGLTNYCDVWTGVNNC